MHVEHYFVFISVLSLQLLIISFNDNITKYRISSIIWSALNFLTCFIFNILTRTTTTIFLVEKGIALLLSPFYSSSDSPIMELYYIVLSLPLCIVLFSVLLLNKFSLIHSFIRSVFINCEHS